MSVNQKEFDNFWRVPVIRIGVSTVVISMLLCFLPCLYLYVNYGVFPTWKQAVEGWILIASIYGAFYVVEPISYYPILGMTGTYISFLSGNIGNVRVPSAAVALDVVGEESGTPEAEMVSTLGIAGSVVTNLFFVSLAAVVGAAVLGALPESIQTALKFYTVPAIFGAMFGQFGTRLPLMVPFAFCIPMGLLYYAAQLPATAWMSQAWFVIPCAVFGTIIVSRVFYKAKIVK